jgi:hypothetical protein
MFVVSRDAGRESNSTTDRPYGHPDQLVEPPPRSAPDGCHGAVLACSPSPRDRTVMSPGSVAHRMVKGWNGARRSNDT